MHEATQRVVHLFPNRFSLLTLCQSLERILYVWAIRHPASGYVQGINDLATPFFQVFLSAYIGMLSDLLCSLFIPIVESDPEDFNPSLLPPSALAAVEADTFWCLSRLLDGIQDNYISAQPGIHRSVRRMSELVKRIDGTVLFPHRATTKLRHRSPFIRSPGCRGRRVYAICVQVDELLAYAGDQCEEYHPDVGYLPCESGMPWFIFYC